LREKEEKRNERGRWLKREGGYSGRYLWEGEEAMRNEK